MTAAGGAIHICGNISAATSPSTSRGAMYRRIMIVVDDRPVSRCAAREGIALAKANDADVEFFTVMPRLAPAISDLPSLATVSPPELELAVRAAADELLGRMVALAEREGVMARASRGHEDDGVSAIVEAAERRRCDLIVVASEGRNAVMRLFVESLVPALITASPVPLLICKQPPVQRAEGGGVVTASATRAADGRRKGSE